MPLPLPVPSKAAIQALRGIALGTSCAIGVIVEDRRRRISTLKTAVSNKEKLRSARQFHGMVNPAALQLDDAIFVGDELHWHQLDDGSRTSHDYPTARRRRHRNPTQYACLEAEAAAPLEPEDIPESSSSPTTGETQFSSPQHTQRNTVPSLNDLRRPPAFPQTKLHPSAISPSESSQTGGTTIPKQRSRTANQLAKLVTRILTGKDEERLDRALNRFLELSRTHYSSKHFDDEWIALSAQLSKECQEKGKWEDASQVLSVTVSAGPLDEHQFYAHEPIPIIEFWLRQVDENGRCPSEAIAAASHLFLATFKEKPSMYHADVERIGRQLFALNLQANNSCVHNIYWRVLGLLKNPVEFTGSAIQELHQYEDHKNVVRYFLLNFSKMSPNFKYYNETVDCVISSVEGLKGWKADQVLRALGQMNCPGNGYLRSRWLMKLLQAYWHRSQDFPESVALFDEISSMGLLDRIAHPMGVYRTMVEISFKAGEGDMARSYHNEVILKYPDMAEDVALKGFVALALAKAGDWGSVLEAFTEMRDLRHGQETEYDNAFVMTLKVFAETHPVSEVRDFVSKYSSALGVRMHPYIVTLVANKYGECHDMSGFMSWLAYCSREGLALDSSLCNAVLHNCRTKWNLSYPELQMLYSKIRELDPTLINDVTRRIMSQAALSANKSKGKNKNKRELKIRVVTVNKLAYTGRTTSKRDIYEAMNQEMNSGRSASAISIYKRALRFGMPSCRYCLRLAVLAALRNDHNGSSSAMTLIHTAHEQGGDVDLAVSTFIRFQLDNMQATANDTLIFMRNLISRFEAMHVIIDTAVLTHMAMICTRLGHHERAIALCKLETDRGGHANICFSRQSIKVLLTAYTQLLDSEGMKKLIDDLLVSEFSADRPVLLYLKSARRTVQKYRTNASANALLDTIQHGIEVVSTRRAEERAQGGMISQETLRIMQDALADMQNKKTPLASQNSGKYEEAQHHQDSSKGSRLVAVEG
ncbi:hypothetical protein F4820DRAFT_419131 [Hypoxylon rubiginosum]|uniref:Uncharacterized protein n=1 Tax=Hypoxylon rubiginosum TaxID=110542 RepID=A0ACB9Z472_9PEZI|nr:hypothetical protein F4820DRAFT_419131 [Hypoxylon rubiginosum]